MRFGRCALEIAWLNMRQTDMPSMSYVRANTVSQEGRSMQKGRGDSTCRANGVRNLCQSRRRTHGLLGDPLIPLFGRWFVESMDGARIEMGPGELSFGGDQRCRGAEGKLGHRSGTRGGASAVLMVIQFEDAPAASSPCAFR